MFPPKEKRGEFMYNDLPIKISGPGQYGEHPDYSYLEGRKLDDVYPSGAWSTWSGRLPNEKAQVFLAENSDMPAWKRRERDRSEGK